MKYCRVVDLARLLEVDYDFLTKYLRNNKEVIPPHPLGKYNLKDFIDLHTFPRVPDGPAEKIDISLLNEKGVVTLPEAHQELSNYGLKIHYTTFWRKIKNLSVTHIKIGKAIRIPHYVLFREIEKGTFSKQK